MSRPPNPTIAIAWFAARHVAPRAGIALALGLIASAVAVRAHPDTTADAVDTAAAWLHLPLLIGAVVAAAAALEVHPGFGRDRADGAWIRRLRTGPLDGCGTVAIGAAVTLAVLAALAGALFEGLVRPGPGRPVTDRIELVATTGSRLDPSRPSLELVPRRPLRDVRSIELRPLVAFVGGTIPEPIVRVLLDDRDATGPCPLPAGGGLLRIATPGQSVQRVVLQLEPGQRCVVLLPPRAAWAIASTDLSAVANAAIAAATSAFAIGLALAIAALARRRLALPLMHVAVAAMVGLSIATDQAPVTPAVAAYARGVVCWTADTGSAALVSGLATILSVAAAAAWVRLRGR